jgi:hypothetical protein
MTDLAEMLRSKGRGRDTVLAHITPKEAALLKSRGGRGSRNPHTGLPEFEDGDYSPIVDTSADTGGASEFGGAPVAPEQPAAPEQPVDQSGGGSAAPTGGDPEILPEGGFDMSQYAGQPQPQIDSSVTGEGAFAPGAQDLATTPRADPSTYDQSEGSDNTIKNLFDKYGSNILKLLGPAALAAFGAKTGTAAAQQGQAGAAQIAALAPATEARANAATQTMTGQLAPAAQQFGQQYGGQVANVQNQLRGVAGNVAAYGQPLIDIGANQMTQALSGGLTPAGQRAYEAQKAQAEQNVASRGGVGAMQAGRAEMDALANLAQQQFQQGQATYQAGAQYGVQGQSLLAQAAQLGLNSAQVELAQNNLAGTIQQNAINLGLQQAGIADQYLIQSIKMGLASDQQTAANLTNLYSKMAQIAFSQPTTTTTTTRPAA